MLCDIPVVTAAFVGQSATLYSHIIFYAKK